MLPLTHPSSPAYRLSKNVQKKSDVESDVSSGVEEHSDKSRSVELISSSSSDEDDDDANKEFFGDFSIFFFLFQFGGKIIRKKNFYSTARRSKSEPLSTTETGEGGIEDAENQQPTMWLGTEDGNIHVYLCSDNIRIKKNKVKIQHTSSVQSIM